MVNALADRPLALLQTAHVAVHSVVTLAFLLLLQTLVLVLDVALLLVNGRQQAAFAAAVLFLRNI